MINHNSIVNTFRKNTFFYLVYMPCTTFIVFVGLLLLCYPEIATEGVKKGMSVCLNVLIPSLFPFMLLSQFALELNLLNPICRYFSKITAFFFALPHEALPIIIFSIIGGYPVGAMLIKSAYENGVITESQGKRMLLFCVNPGPSFAISTIGYSLFGSKKVGVIVYFSSVISALIMGILSRFLNDREIILKSDKESNKKPVNLAFAVNKSTNIAIKSIVNVCVWVIIFSCLGELMNLFNTSEKALQFTRMISEVTGGVYCAAESYDLPVVCAIIGFSGFCLHIQILPSIIKLRLKYKYFLVSRIIAASFNCIICYLLMDAFPQSVSTVAFGTKQEVVKVASSVPLCICLMLLCGLFMAGESFISVQRKRRATNNE